MGDVEDLKAKTIRGGTARFAGQLGRSAIRLGSIMVLARLLDPEDFGIVAMVTVLTGVFEIFSTGGLSAATVQRAQISGRQVSALFWFNMAIGLLLAVLCLLAAPLLEIVYQDSRTAYALIAMAPAFIVTGAGVQHIALLQRQMRLYTLSVIEVLGEIISGVIAIVMALAGFGYWSLIAALVALPFFTTLGAWFATRFVPNWPRRGNDVASLLSFGGTVAVNNLVVYAAYNFEKLLLGRYFGSDALGLYSRAYELINLPTRVINSAFGGVSFAALSRVQADPARFKSYFLKGYSLVLSISLPTTIFCAAHAEDVILVVLGPKWVEGTTIFRLLAPTILVFGIINPFGWMLQSKGLHKRSLHLALVIAPVAIGSYLVGIPYGPNGVALAYSTAMSLWLVPHVVWCLHGTSISLRDLLPTIARPLLAGIAAALAATVVTHFTASIPYPIARLGLAGSTMLAVYTWALLFVMKQKEFYVDLLHQLRRPA